jgi:ubiquinone biosynthesis protein COQ9
MALPTNIPPSLRELAELSSEMWYLAGDVSVDSSWYTKRVSLAAIYSASEVFMTTDKSPNFEATEEFLDRRLEDAKEVGRVVGGLGKYAGFWAGSALSWGRSMGMRI